MTQFQFDMICKVVQSGAPAIAEELCSSLNDLVVDRNQLAQQVEELTKQVHGSKTAKTDKPTSKLSNN